jgi:hypothetical protein
LPPQVTDRTTINAPTVVNQMPEGPQLNFQVTRDPNNPNRGWILIGNQPVPVKYESGAWMFDTDVSRFQLVPPAPPRNGQPTGQQQQQPPDPPAGPTNGQTAQPTQTIPLPPGYMSIGVAQELLAIEKIELYRALIHRMRILATNTQVGSVDEFNIIIQRLESLLQEMERLQNSPHPQN